MVLWVAAGARVVSRRPLHHNKFLSYLLLARKASDAQYGKGKRESGFGRRQAHGVILPDQSITVVCAVRNSVSSGLGSEVCWKIEK